MKLPVIFLPFAFVKICVSLRTVQNTCQRFGRLGSMKNFEQSVFLNKKIAVALISSYASLQVPAIAVGDSLPTTYVVQSEPVISRSITTASGLQYYDAIVGTGSEIVQEGSSVQFQWVLRRSNGYFVDSSQNYGDEPFIYRVGNLKKVIKGIDEGIRGMRVGGVRRLNIPPNLAFADGVGDDKPGPMPAGFGPRRQIITRLDREVWYFEIKLTKLKN